MAITTEAPVLALTNELTYEAYMAEPEVRGRYDIVHGVRVFQPPVSWRRQRIIGHLSSAVFVRKRTHGDHSVPSPFDLLIRREPLQIRQPDLLLISHERLMQNGGPPEIGPLEVGPELVVEIVLEEDMEQLLRDKITDYQAMKVDECWVVRPKSGTVEVLILTRGKVRSFATYGEGEIVHSLIFKGLSVPVADVFED